MRELATQIWALEQCDTQVLAKYLRCMLKATLPMDHKIALGVIKEISMMVKQLASVSLD
jgi:hypothetical protein